VAIGYRPKPAGEAVVDLQRRTLLSPFHAIGGGEIRSTRHVRSVLSLQSFVKKQTKNVTAAAEIPVISSSTAMVSSRSSPCVVHRDST
jgi:hypothetical protein